MDTGAGLGGKTIPLYYGWGSSDSVITDPNGYFSISKLVSLNQNNYVITANFLGDFIFSGSSVTTILHVSSPSYYTINFYTNPSNVGSIIFSGTTYTNGQSGSYASGSYVIVANVPSGYKFAGWTYSGGVSVSSPSSSSTTATVSGSGILTANFQSSTGNLQVTVKNANGNFISGATVKLYDSNWNWLNQDRITDSYGNAYWSNLNSGTYNIEVYYNPNVGLALTEFWGSNQVNVPSSGTANFVFTRHAPYISDIAFSASSINLGQSITAYVTITNPESFAVNCKARLILDRDYSSPYDYDSILGPQSIPSYGGTYTFNFIWTPSQEGTYYQYGVAYSYYNGTYIETDQWIWTQAFTVGAASDFSISANPNSLSFTKPSSGSTSKTSTITITSINNFNSQVSLSGSWIGTVPSGVTYSFSKNPVTPPSNGQDTSTLTITVSSAAGTGTFTLRISGTSGSLSHYVDISISISSQPTGSLQVSVNYPGGGSVTPETLILYDANWNEKSRISPSTNIYTFLDLTPGSYHVEAYYYDMWIGDALNIQVSSGQITSVTITTLRIQPLTITVYYSDGATPLFGANVTIYSHDSYYDRDNYRRAYATGINGKAYFYIWPTSKPSEYYKAYVHYAGKEIGSNTNVQVNKDNGSSISIITSLPFNGKRIPPEQISLIPQETDKSCWAASSKMILDFYGTYSGKSYSQIEIAQEMGSEYYYWNGLSVLLLKSWDWTLSRLGKLDADPDYGVVTESLTFDKVKSDIELNRPIIAFYAGDLWIIPNLLPYHAVVIVGYIDEDGELNDKVIVYDPWPPNKGEAQTRLWKDVKEELWTICNGFRTEPQVLEGTTLTLYESGHKLYLHVYDSQGRHVGMDHESGQIEIGIPNAKYTDFDFGIAIVLPSSIIDFNYVIDATRSENTTESYKIVTTTLRQGMIILEDAKSGIIEQGEKQDYNFQISQEPWWIVYQSWLIVGIPSMIIVVAAIFLISKKRDKKVKTLPRLSDKKRNRKVKHLVLPHLRIFWSRIP
jgi:hypothetical protein